MTAVMEASLTTKPYGWVGSFEVVKGQGRTQRPIRWRWLRPALITLPQAKRDRDRYNDWCLMSERPLGYDVDWEGWAIEVDMVTVRVIVRQRRDA